ncbi:MULTISPECIES: contact-dependent growth inhibition system immunity protein [Enterobacteriaceae]|uniref:contact-dependent growth inhibition system immunity protein n=1 Tax=Enterobacteriaceae TaxID=543 RepID=UPI0011A9598D|nr:MULTISPECIES: contact-dependent growth inhibition system immunity protein [Enterobacteriaceae]
MFSRLIRSWGNKPEKQYPALSGMLRVFLSCHHDDYGNTIEEMLQSYIDYQMPVTDARNEISALLKNEDDYDLNIIMSEIAGEEFIPAAWGETWRSFLTRAMTTLNSEH